MSTELFRFPKEPTLPMSALLASALRSPSIVHGAWQVDVAHSARYALFRILNALPHSSDDEILVPAYACISLIEAIRAAGYVPRFYDTGSLTTTSAAAIAELTSRHTRALVIIHYFGFEQDTSNLSEMCRAQAILLIEDFAHSLPIQDLSSESSRVRNCDIALFSLKKLLPLRDGGFVIYKSSLPIQPVAVMRLPTAVAGRLLYEVAEQRLLSKAAGLRQRVAKANFRKHRGQAHCDLLVDFDETPPLDQMPSQYSFMGEASKWGPSRTAMNYWFNCDLQDIADRRNRNAAFLRKSLASISGVEFPLVESRAHGCLWALPFLWEELTDCDRELRAAGVPVFTFARPLHPAVDPARFPAARRWSRTLKLLPIHQDLTIADLQQLPPLFSAIAVRRKSRS